MHCKVVCQQGAFAPIGNPEVKEPAVPSQSQPSHSLEREKFMRHKAPTGSPVGAAALVDTLSS